MGNASVTSVKSSHSDQEQRRASAFKPTESNVKGGFLAPTKAWLSLRGENVSLNSRSPSPGSKMSIDKERSVSPKRKLRESSAESEASQSRKSVSFGLKERRAIDKDPALPTTVRRSSSLRASSEAAAGKRTRVLKKASMENLTTQNGVNEQSKAKKDASLTSRTSKENVSLRQTSRSKESVKRNGEGKPGRAPSRDVSKENTKLSAVKRSSSLRRDSSKEKTKKEVSTSNNGLSENEAKGSNLRKRNASKENGSTKTSSKGALENGVGAIRHTFNGTAAESDKKETTSIENGHMEIVDKSAKVTKNSSAKSESRSKEVISIKNETNKTKKAATETATKSELTETAKTTISSSSTVSAVSRSSTERRSSESKANLSKSSLASMSQMKMVQKGKSSSSSEKTSSELVAETSTETSTSSTSSSSQEVKEICETESKTTSSNRVKTSSNSAIVASSTTSCVRAEGSTPRADLLRTTMVVRFRPGQPNQQGAWLAEVQTGSSTTSSICGLEISFSSVPQDIDIKVIPSDSNEEFGGAPPREEESDKQSS